MAVFTPDIEGGNVNALKVDGSAVTQPVSGTVTANAGTGTFNVAGSVTVTQATGTNLHAVVDSGSVSVSNFPASQVVTQATGTNLHTVVDSGTITANAGTGNFTVVQPTGTNLHVVVDSGTITTAANKSGTATISRVATSTTAVTLLAANANRKKLVIRTETGTHNYVAFGSTATATNYTYDLGSDSTLEDEVWTGSVSLIRASGTGNVQVTEEV